MFQNLHIIRLTSNKLWSLSFVGPNPNFPKLRKKSAAYFKHKVSYIKKYSKENQQLSKMNPNSLLDKCFNGIFSVFYGQIKY